jgi:hypothetical protein
MKSLTLLFGDSIKVTNVVHELATVCQDKGLMIQLTTSDRTVAAYSSIDKTIVLNLQAIKNCKTSLSEALTHEIIHFIQDLVLPFDGATYIKRPAVLQEILPTVTEGARYLPNVMNRYDVEDWNHEEQAFRYQGKPALVLKAARTI